SELRDLQMLVAHEKAHLDKAHWIDLVLAQIVLIFQWFNPAAWFMRRELQRIHEYEADEAVLQSGVEEKEYQMLLIQNISGNRYSGLTDGLNNCSLKKRIIMMKKTKFKKDRVIRGIAVCGFAFLGGLIIHIPAVAEVLESSPLSIESKEKLIVIQGEGKDPKEEKDVEYYVDELRTQKENLASVDPSNIKEIKIDKSTETPKVEITTKKAPDRNNIDKKDSFSDDKKKGELENYPDAYLSVDKIAEYEGGEIQLLKDLINSIQYPQEAEQNDIQGRVVVSFQINTNGTISNCEVAYSQHPVLNEAALKAVESLPGKWKPAEVDGKPVASVFNLPVTFRLQSSDKESK
ncbi:MAG: TonB family protein, partial [Muribaculaceae bacterium]|nr:TonB family protein [Muribaculaceae bacterium]